MKVLSIGTDENVFKDGSGVRTRQKSYAECFGSSQVVVISKGPHDPIIDGPLRIYAAYAKSPFVRLLQSYRIAKSLEKPEIVSAQDPFENGLVALLVARYFKVPLHVQIHTDFLAPAFAQHSFVNRIRVLLAGIVLPRAVRIRVVSDRIRVSLIHKYSLSVPVAVLPIYVDVERFKHSEIKPDLSSRFAEFRTKVLVVSRLEPEKNTRLAIHAFAQAAPHDACLIIVGNGSLRRSLEAQVNELGVAGRVFFEGASETAPYYALADLILVTSKYEGYGLVTVEALAAGKPVLSTDVGIAREAGATISSEARFADDLKIWFGTGPRTGALSGYPYANFDDYRRLYCANVCGL